MTQRISPTGSYGGFTLLELMLAIAIGGIALTAVYNLFAVGVDTQRRVARVASQTQAWRFYAERLRADLRNLLVDKERTLRGDQNSLTFSLANAEQIRYEWRGQAGDSEVRRIVLNAEGRIDSETVVYAGAKSFGFRYFDAGKWVNQPGEVLPSAVECTFLNDQGEQRLVVALEVEHSGE